MDNYITGTVIKQLREKQGLTQLQLAEKINVSDKAVSKWETAKGFPDISLVEPLAAALGVSVIELMSGDHVTNKNRAFNVLRSRLYVCPVCGNVIFSGGDTVISCCGITLPPLDADAADADHAVTVEDVEDEKFISVDHSMTHEHYISFAAYVTWDRFQIIKFYPEGPAQCRFRLCGDGYLYIYCNRHGLMKTRI